MSGQSQNQRLNLLVGNLKQVVRHNPYLGADARENIESLKSELEFLQGMLKDFSRSDYGSSYLMQTLKEIRSVLDEAEDAVDSYMFLAANKSSRSWLSRSLHPKLWEAGEKIAYAAKKVRQIYEDKIRAVAEVLHSQSIPQDYGSEGMSTETKVPSVEGDHLIGFEDPAKQVKELLTGGPEDLQVITIAGMGGLGKTTLAKMVYNDVDSEYMIRAFVCISMQYDKKDVLLKILSSFSETNEGLKNMQEVDLEKHVCQQLNGIPYLVVLDDVWMAEDWDALKGAFPKNDKRCRVLITTRNASLAQYANPTNPYSLYLLDLLSFENSRNLLLWKVFGHDNIPDKIEPYVKEIVRKCDGLPLAILLTASVLLDHRDTAAWWEEVNGSVYKYLSMDESGGYKVTKMVYEHLPNKLKPCFIYLGVFPEGYEIPVWKLVRLWISEGFIDGEGNSNLEDIAEQYLANLVRRNLVMVGQRTSNGKIKTCRLHDILGDFCKYEAREENLFQEINRRNLKYNSSGYGSLDNCRRVCLNASITVESMCRRVSGTSVRSFLTFQEKESTVEPQHVSLIPRTFKLLKVLEAHPLCFLRLFPADLCRLVLLKYLAISSTFSKIPSQLSGLWNLQTLVVTTTSETLEVQVDLWKMPHFRHFHTNSTANLLTKSHRREEDSVGRRVRTLCTISPESCNDKILDRTPELRKLGIRGDLAKLFEINGDSKEPFKIMKLEELENLKFINARENSKLNCPPFHTWLPRRLTKLTLMDTRLEWSEMSSLGKLPNLEALKLKEFAFEGECWDTEEGGFALLVYLYIGATDLISWKGASEATFPRLKTLKLDGCDKLEELPAELVKIPSLQSLDLRCTNSKVASSARKLVLESKENNLRLSIYPPHHSESSL